MEISISQLKIDLFCCKRMSKHRDNNIPIKENIEIIVECTYSTVILVYLALQSLTDNIALLIRKL